MRAVPTLYRGNGFKLSKGGTAVRPKTVENKKTHRCVHRADPIAETVRPKTVEFILKKPIDVHNTVEYKTTCR